MNKIFLTQEIGSIQRPIWRIKLNADANEKWIRDALDWGEKLNIKERFELANEKGTGLLQKNGSTRTQKEKQRIIDISTIYVIRMLEKAGLDRIFNGEQPRTEMYDMLARKVNGIEAAGFVNSFDANYFRKGIIQGKVSIKEEGIKWFKEELEFARKHTSKELKPCLTGPYTMTDWSYVEYYSEKQEKKFSGLEALKKGRREAVIDFAKNVLNPIVKEYVKAGVKVIQIDEPAASTKEHEADLVVEGINETFKGVPRDVEKAVHFCYSNYSSLFPELADSVADSYLIECTNHSAGIEFNPNQIHEEALKVIELFKEYSMNVNIGAGLIDIHSDLIEPPETIRDIILYINKLIENPARVQVNPDCGLRTRKWKIAFAKLINMVKGAELARKEVI
jgi:5-methyltetrahydropteroyltriglutamate--homocysteine methyltransferase